MTACGVSYPDFREYRTRSASFENLEAFANEGGVLSDQGNPPDRYRMARVSAGMFDMLHTQPAMGRGFRAEDDQPGAAAVVLLGYGIWRDRYGSSPDVLHRAVRVNEEPATIIGVMPEGFRFPNQEDLWMPLVPTNKLEARDKRSLLLVGILKPGTTDGRGGRRSWGHCQPSRKRIPRHQQGHRHRPRNLPRALQRRARYAWCFR